MQCISIDFDFSPQTKGGRPSGFFSAANVGPKREKSAAVTHAIEKFCELKLQPMQSELTPSATDAGNQSFTVTFTNIDRRYNLRAL
jgi:hypothetical protein